jgi:hypothetical protein
MICIAGYFSGIAFIVPVYAQGNKQAFIHVSEQDRLGYHIDSLGNRMPDFSYAGYQAGEVIIPTIDVKAVVPVIHGDATLHIQTALDYVASLPLDKYGFRGAVLLREGDYEVKGSLMINASGIVLRGSGFVENGTKIIATGQSRSTLIQIKGQGQRLLEESKRITDSYVPVNATSVTLSNVKSIRIGDRILINRPSTQRWINELGMDHFGGGITSLGWKPGSRDLNWDRMVTAIKGNTVSFDAPITTALDTTYGGGTVTKYIWKDLVENVGIENIVLESIFDKNNPKDENHRWMAITMDNVEDAWVRQVIFRHFSGSAVSIQSNARRITVEDCMSLQPVSEIGGQRRYTFTTTGQQCLFQRLYAEFGYHDFSVGFLAAGPNVFVQCFSKEALNFSGAIDSWSSGALFDNVDIDGQALSFNNRGQDGNGAGWAASSSVFWQSTAAIIENFSPPHAQNWSFGSWAQFVGNGYWSQSNEHVKPQSLYYAQLSDRLGKHVYERSFLKPVLSGASSSPTTEVAAALTTLSEQPALSLKEFIYQVALEQPIDTMSSGATLINRVDVPKSRSKAPKLSLKNGWLVRGDQVQIGRRQDVQWWSGSSRSYWLEKAKPHITRFVPGQTGTGLTDNLQEVVEEMKKTNTIMMEHNYGLWYDRRRDDHQRVRRMSGEVWPPFYELPFARSGQGTAWDGLSKYDLMSYNPWYWSRLKQFADLADEKGLMLIHQQYFQHNILEAGAHYADFPWRTANNINDVGFPEPPFYAGDKRIFMDEQFYDISHPVRREIHRAYIRQCLDNFKDNNGVIQLTGAEYTGPLHFMQFWIDVVKEWEEENNKSVLLGLSATKDVQDAILEDPIRSQIVKLIDIRYWNYQSDGSVYAPEGGKHLAPRQHARIQKTGKTSFESVYRGVYEYRQKYPNKAVMYSYGNYDKFGWAVLMAGGSLSDVPRNVPEGLFEAIGEMSPKELGATNTYMLSGEKGSLVYSASTEDVRIDLDNKKGNYSLTWIDPKTGIQIGKRQVIKGERVHSIKKTLIEDGLLWIKLVE